MPANLFSTAAVIPSTFQQFQYTKWGTTENEWKIAYDVPQKPLKPTHVRVKVVNAGLNPFDFKVAEYGAHWFPSAPSDEAPFVVGFDAAGVVVEVGADVTGFKVGDAVYLETPIDDFGTVAEYICVDAQYVAPKPTNLDFAEAAGVPIVGLTSYQALLGRGALKAGERVLVLGGSSATGMFGIQLAKALGVHVIATASEGKVAFIKSLGADQVIDYTTEKWVDVLDAHSIDLIYDCGFELQAWTGAAQKILKKVTGRFITLAHKYEELPVSPIGARGEHHICQSSGKDLREITKFIENGQIKVVVDSVHPFESTVDAMSKVKSGRVLGKVVISVGKE
uniref:Enoyl reductase (ER) domain-containing protein n=1 Tax=Globisporangium ultimum (strain ATCC 200006 / CBS 805.95 / DAOM BR144) TaxID=431595 RepID=K3WBZ9_GLOUD